MTRTRWMGLGRHATLLVAALAMIFPLIMMATTGLKTNAEYARSAAGIPTHPTLSNVSTVLSDPRLGTWLVNSLVITVSAVLVAIVAAVLAAYPLARSESRSSRGFVSGLVMLMAVPPVVLVVPLFITMVHLGLLNSRLGVIVAYGGLLTPLLTYLLRGFIRSIPMALDEAASIDGAGRLQVLLFVLLPMMRPALMTAFVVGAVYVWNEFLIALLFLQSNSSQTIMVGIAALQGKYGIDETLLGAWSLIASLPIIVAYAFGQRFLVRGLVAGALK